MKKFVLRSVILIFGCLLVLSSCSNFANSSELKDKLDKAIDYANSDPVDLYFSSTHGKISPSGKISYKVTDQISLMFNEDNDWQFVKWQSFDQNDNDISDLGYISMEDWESSTTKATFEKNPKNITLNIVPLCASRPKVISWTPSLNSDGAYRDARIAVSFDHGIHQDSIYFTDAEIENLKKKGVTDFLQISSSSEEWTYGYKKDGKIFYKNISIYDKETGENLLDRYGEPEFEGNDTFVLPTKNGENAPIAGTQIIVELKDFFYEHDDESLKDENRIIKMNDSQKWHYFVNGNTDTLAPSLPDGYFIKTSGKDLGDKERAILKTSLNVNNQNDLKSIYLKDKKLHVEASVFDSGSGLAPSGYSNGKIVTSGLWAQVKRVYNQHYIPVTESEKTVYLPVKTVSSIATCDTEIDFASMNMKDGIYHIDFYAKDKNGNGTTKVLKDGGFVLIDETAPDKVDNLNPSYYAESSNASYDVHWKNPEEPDFDHMEFVAESDDSAKPLSDTKDLKDSPYSVPLEYMKNDVTFTFKATPVDIFGNRGETTVKTHTPKTNTILKSIELNQNHFDGIIKDQTVTASVSFESLATRQMKMVLKEKGASSPVQTANPDINTSSGTASYKFKLPNLSSTTVAGKEYEIYVTDASGNIIKDVDENDLKARLIVTSQPVVSTFKIDKTTMPLSSVNSTTTVKATITGTNLDLKQMYVQFYKLYREVDSKGSWISSSTTTTEYGEKIPVDTSSLAWYPDKNNSAAQTITVDVKVPQEDDLYCLKVFYNTTEKSTSTVKNLPQLYVYKNPTFTSFYVPKSVPSKAGNKVAATITGKNLEAPGEEYTFSCPSDPTITNGCTYSINSDTKMTVNLTVPYGGGGNYEIYATSKTDGTKIKGEMKIYKCDYSVGDLILSNGEIIPYDDEREAFNEEEFSGAVPIGVIGGISKEVAPQFIVGIHNSDGDTTKTLKWAPSGTTGYATNFTGIYGKKDSGDMDGSDNWDYVCSVDPEGTKNAAANYPAFNWANTYGTSYNLPENCRNGWYLPSCAELYTISLNRYIINEVIGKIPAKYTPIQLRRNYYWSSSQSNYDNNAYYVDLANGDVNYNYLKSTNYYVCSIQAFNY